MNESDLRPFQRRFLRSAFADDVEIAAVSLPRGGGKTKLAGYLAARALTPGDPLHVPGANNVIVAGSLKQTRVAFRVARAILGEDGFRYEDSNQNIKALHVRSLARVEAHAANSKTAWGWLGARLIVVDEPAVVGRDLWDAITTSAGKTRMEAPRRRRASPGAGVRRRPPVAGSLPRSASPLYKQEPHCP